MNCSEMVSGADVLQCVQGWGWVAVNVLVVAMLVAALAGCALRVGRGD